MDEGIPIIPSPLRVGGFMDVDFALKAVRQILNIFDFDL